MTIILIIIKQFTFELWQVTACLLEVKMMVYTGQGRSKLKSVQVNFQYTKMLLLSARVIDEIFATF
jgi:hypothetical protein